MVFIINRKTYDTEKAEKILEFKRKWYFDSAFGQLGIWKSTTLYRTQKGNWFITSKGDWDIDVVDTLMEEDVKRMLSNCNEVDLYNKYFDTLEEA